MWCLRCGERAADPGENCENCGNDLGSPDNRVGYFNQIMKLTGELLTEQLSVEDYERSIQWATEAMDDMGKDLEPIENQMKTMGFDELALSLMNRPIKSFREGIQTFHQGLEKLRYYVYEQNQSHLYNGLTLLEKANNLFNYTADTANYMISDISKQLPGEEVEKLRVQAEKGLKKQ